jgi:hypothetical protein
MDEPLEVAPAGVGLDAESRNHGRRPGVGGGVEEAIDEDGGGEGDLAGLPEEDEYGAARGLEVEDGGLEPGAVEAVHVDA